MVSELERCGVGTGNLNSKIEKLAWFVGGDSSKIRELQRALNNLGVGLHLNEDGVYGEKTKQAVDAMIDRVSEFLTNQDKIQDLKSTIDMAIYVLDALRGPQSQIWELHKILEQCRYEMQRHIWKWGAKHYLREPRGHDVAALLLEHSLRESPGNLIFSQSSLVVQKILKSKSFREAFLESEKNIQKNPDEYAVAGSFDVDFSSYDEDEDLHLGIGKCTFRYTCKRDSSSVRVMFTMEDKYNFDHIRTIRGSAEHILAFDTKRANLANDAALLSQADGVISVYNIFVYFEKTIELGDIFREKQKSSFPSSSVDFFNYLCGHFLFLLDVRRVVYQSGS